MNTAYIDFDLELRRGVVDYVAAVLNSPFGEPSNNFAILFTQEELRALTHGTEEIDRGLHLIAASQTSTALSPAIVGERLFDAVFDRGIHTAFLQRLDVARDDKFGLRLRLRKDVPELALAWEFLCHAQGEHLALSIETSVVRHVKLDYARPVDPVEPPLKILAVVANAADDPALDVEREYALLEQALAGVYQRQLGLDRLPAATIAALNDRLREDDIHVIHFIGHGYFDEESKVDGLVFEDENGRADYVDADQLRVLFEDRATLRIYCSLLLRNLRAGNFDRATVHRSDALSLLPGNLLKYALVEARYQDLFVNLKTTTLLSAARSV